MIMNKSEINLSSLKGLMGRLCQHPTVDTQAREVLFEAMVALCAISDHATEQGWDLPIVIDVPKEFLK